MTDSYSHMDFAAADPLGDFRALMAAGGVQRAVLVETLAGDNRRVLETLLEKPDPAFRLAFRYRPESAADLVARLAHRMVVALRVNTQQLESETSYLTAVEASGKWLLVHAEKGIAPLAKLLHTAAERHPRLRIYVPHFGWPRRDGQDDPAWRESLDILERIPGCMLGISSLKHFSREPFPHADLWSFADTVIRRFGATRVVAGSDFPYVDRARYGEYVREAHRWIRETCPAWKDAYPFFVE